MPNKTLGDRIALIRVKLEKNQTDFAKLFGFSDPATVSKWESNDRKPKIEILQKIAELGEKDLGWLITGKDSLSGKEAFDATFNYNDEEKNPYKKRMIELKEENEQLKKKLAVYEKAIPYLDKLKEIIKNDP